MKLDYAVVYERTPNNYGAYAPELPRLRRHWQELAGDSDNDTRSHRSDRAGWVR